MDKETKAFIDAMSYEAMLRRNRFAPSSDSLMQGEIGTYFLKVMCKKRNAMPALEQTDISKRIGWNQRR